MTRLSDEDRALVTAAVAKAEQESDGEIVAVVAPRSDAYHDVALHYAVLAMLVVPAKLAVLPQAWIDRAMALTLGWNAEPSRGALMLILFVLLTIAFLIVRLVLTYMPLRMALTPGRTKTRRVHRRAIEHFRTSCERKTHGRTGVLIYLSLAERRAEIVADKAIASQVEPNVWGEAMAVLVDEVKAGRPGRRPGQGDRAGRRGAGAHPAADAGQSERAAGPGDRVMKARGRYAGRWRRNCLGRPVHRGKAARQVGICLPNPRHQRRRDPRRRQGSRPARRAVSGPARHALPGAAGWSGRRRGRRRGGGNGRDPRARGGDRLPRRANGRSRAIPRVARHVVRGVHPASRRGPDRGPATGGGVEGEEIVVHRVPLPRSAGFVAAKRAEGCAVDAKMLLLLGAIYLEFRAEIWRTPVLAATYRKLSA